MTQNISKVGKYPIKEKIAEGGMGVIYKAKHPTLNIDVILKKLTLKQNSSITERFKREAKIMIEFRDDHIVQVYDHFKEGRSFYIVMEYVDGIDLGQLIERERYLDNEIALVIFSEIAKALKYAHDKGVIHRDIKPENVLISKNGEVKLTDFGIATSEEVEDKGLTRNTTLGTPAYMSPEQFSSSKDVDKRSDIYSMGVVLYEMVTGKCPFPGSMTPEAIMQIQTGKYIAPQKINPNINSPIKKIIKKAMHCKAGKRYNDLQLVIDMLQKSIKKYKTQDMINTAIKEYVYARQAAAQKTTRRQPDSKKQKGKQSKKAQVYKKPAITFRRIVITFCLLGILAGIGIYSYLNGIHYKFLNSPEYGEFSIELKVPVTRKALPEYYIKAELARLHNNKAEKIKNANIQFENIGEVNKSKYYLLQSNTTRLKTGFYRLYLNVENELLYKDFHLAPYSEQNKDGSSLSNSILRFTHSTASNLPVILSYSIYDISNDIDITKECKFDIYYARRWMQWHDAADLDSFKSYFVSGKAFRFRVKKDGYYTTYTRVFVDDHQSNVSININLVPVPGVVMFKSNYPGFKLSLNNSSYYFSGLKKREYKALPQIATTYKKIYLSPGKYFFTVNNQQGIQKTVTLEVERNKINKIIIKNDNANNTFEINQY